MKKTALSLLCAGLLTACGEDQTSTQRDATPASTDPVPAETIDRDPTPETGTGGQSQVQGSGATTK